MSLKKKMEVAKISPITENNWYQWYDWRINHIPESMKSLKAIPNKKLGGLFESKIHRCYYK